ncbi:MAG: alpha/beta hydrolase, partial [bacterium]|nr:alpha/beta hydrolase [bacterium]
MKTQKANVLTQGNGSPVVLLHSSLSSKIQWYQLMGLMGSDYQVIAVDLYGYGDSPFPENKENFSFMEEITLVESLLKDIIAPDEPIHLVGHSYGAAVGLRYCYKPQGQNRQNRRIRSLSLYEPVAFHLLPETEEALAHARQMAEKIKVFASEGKYAAAAEYFVDHWNGTGAFAAFPKQIQVVFSQNIKKLELDFQALIGEPLTLEDYGNIKIPVCLMAGSQSPLQSRRISELLADALPDCRKHWINGGHMAPVSMAAEVNGVIKDFI